MSGWKRRSAGAEREYGSVRKKLLVADGDIIAEGKKHEMIWGRQAVVVRRPLGLVCLDGGGLADPEVTDVRVLPIRTGVARLTVMAGEELRQAADENGCVPLEMNCREGDFLAWNRASRVSSVGELPD